jgi:hypothetical protein
MDGNGHAHKVVQGKAVDSISLGLWLFQGPDDSTKGIVNIFDLASLESLTLNDDDQEPLASHNMNSQSDFPAAPSLITFSISSPFTAGVRFS